MSGPLPQVPSRRLMALSRGYLKRFTARHFAGLRIARDGPPPELDGPTVFYANHPSWWDPIVLLLLIGGRYPDWRFHGPIDASALGRYPWLERLGLFGIEPDRLSGARRFLEVGSALLDLPQTGLAITAEGGFTDVRQRPVVLKRGLGLLLKHKPRARALPIAIEYGFWNERLPEIFVRLGQRPIAANGRGVDEIQTELETSLEHQLDRLSRQVRARDAASFECVLDGRRGVGFLQDLPQRLKARLRGERFDPAHSAVRQRPGRAR